MKEVLQHAHENGYAVAAPNVNWELEARAVIEAAEMMNSPLILDVAYFLHPDVVFLGSYLTELAERSSVPIAINQDHGANFAEAITSIRAGFTGIMVDRSTLPFEENIAQVKELVKIAHSVDVSVESELGHVGDATTYDPKDKSAFTKPEEAKRFVDETGVDSLAVAVGTTHGLYKGTPTLDFELLAELKKILDMPLVLHGGSGTGEENLYKACRQGINKVNIFSELAARALAELDKAKQANDPIYKIFFHIQDGFRDRTCELIEIFDSKDKNWSGRTRGILSKKKVFETTGHTA
jgi:fructose-bisphosphate aldolase, class II